FRRLVAAFPHSHTNRAAAWTLERHGLCAVLVRPDGDVSELDPAVGARHDLLLGSCRCWRRLLRLRCYGADCAAAWKPRTCASSPASSCSSSADKARSASMRRSASMLTDLAIRYLARSTTRRSWNGSGNSRSFPPSAGPIGCGRRG